MKKMKPIGIFMIALTLLYSGCNSKDQVVPTASTMPVPPIEYIDIAMEHKVQLAPYEPVSGIYLGSYVEKNSIIDGSMKKYEEIIGQEQAFRVFQYTQLGDVDQVDLLKCIADKQIPYIKILPNDTFDLTPIYELVGDLSTNYDTPIFIELLPVTNIVEDYDAYKQYYEDAYKAIKKHIEDSVIVWSIDLERAEEAPIYYPGNHMVDWVGMNIYLPQYVDNQPYILDVEGKIDFLYKTFQKDKPLMISTLAISHFSRVDHTYTVEDAKNKLNFFYEDVPKLYPRIKGILYADIDMRQIRSDGIDDYRLTSQEGLITEIGILQSASYYLHEITEETIHSATQSMRYTIPTIKYEGMNYLSEKDLGQITDAFLFHNIEVIVDDRGNKYYALDPLLEMNNMDYIQ